MPSTEQEWKHVVDGFNQLWQFRNCLGAIDGKHITIKKPQKSGSYYYNYKGTFSVVLFAVVNANYEFIYIHMGTNGRISDAGIWKETGLCKRLESNKLNIPHPLYFPEIGCMPYVFIGDEAFPLMKNLMKPYAQRNINIEQKIFNYRLCRARRVVENAFGIMATRFSLFLRSIAIDIDKIDTVVLACCALHNFLRKMSKKNNVTESYVDHEDTHGGTVVPGMWRQIGEL